MPRDDPRPPGRLCGAKTRSGGTCRQRPVRDRNRCRMHGGATVPAGPGHHSWKHGAWSKCFGRFRDAVDAAMDDPDLLDARRGVAAALGALDEAGQRLEARDTPAFRARAVALYEEVRELMAEDPAAAGARLRELGEWLKRGASEDRAFRDVVDRADGYRRAVNDAWKLKLQASAAMNVADLVAALDAMVQLMVEVAGPEAAAEVAARFDQGRLGGRLASSGFQLGGTRSVEAPGKVKR